MKKFTLIIIFAFIANLIIGSAAFAQIALRGSQPATGTTSSISVNMPSGVVQNDVMIAIIAKEGNTSNSTAPAGWNFVAGSNLAGSTARNGTVFYKVAGSGEAGPYSFSLGSGTTNAAATIVAFYNVDVSGATPFDVAPASSLNLGGSGATTATALSITTANTNAAVLMCTMAAGSNPAWSTWNTTSPGSLSEIADIAQGNSSDGASAGAAWALKASAGATGNGTASLSPGERNGAILIALKPTAGAPPPAANLWSANGTGDILKYTVDPVSGNILSGPTSVVTPLTSTAALGKNQITPNDPSGCLYYLNRDDNSTLNGVVTIYAVKPDGTGNGSIGTIDMNGAGDNTDFSFVRLGFDPLGRGWILAGTGSNIYIASFVGKGTGVSGQLTPADINTFGNAPLTVAAPGVASEFSNGDLAISANGTLFALANVTGGQTYIYTLNSLSTPTTLTRKWTVQQNNTTFPSSVNGLAWTQTGSLHFSTGAGIYFIDQTTANSGAGTVQATLVPGSSSTTLTDLASDKFPAQSTLPVTFIDFSVIKSGSSALLKWSTATEVNNDHFDIQRSVDGINFTSIGSVSGNGTTSSVSNYQFIDPLSSVTDKMLYYRIVQVDVNSKSSNSKIVALKLNGGIIKDMTVFPNPFTSDLRVQITSNKETVATIRINNVSGQQVVNRKVNLQPGENIVVLQNLEALMPGLHLMEIITEDGKVTQKIMKK